MPRDLWTSISAIENAGGKFGEGGCFRRWWLDKCMKLPTPKKKATIFGDVHHAVGARFFLADDRGLVDGKPVNLYPEGWMSHAEKFGTNKNQIFTVSDAEASLIQILVDKAITEGIWVREPGRRVEQPVGDYMYKDKTTGEKQYGRVLCTEGNVKKVKAILKGFIDLETPTRIEDHKTAKDTKYCLSKKDLHKSIQMMTYALDKYERGHKGNLWLAHNNFIKDFDRPQVIKREIEVTEAEVYQFYNDITLPLVKKMFQLYLYYTKDKINMWRDVPPPNNPNQECNYYYGKPCPFITICSGNCSIETYLAGYGQRINIEEQEEKSIERKTKMGLLDKIKAQNATLTAGGVAANTSAQPNAQTTTAQETNTQATLQELPQQNAAAPATTGTVAPVTGLSAIMQKYNKPNVQAQAPAPVVTPPAPVETPAPVTPVQQPAPAQKKQRAPWYSEVNGVPCVACGQNEVLGFNSKGEPCRVCNVVAQREGRPTSASYNTDVVDGRIVITLKTVQTDLTVNKAPAQTAQPVQQSVTLAKPAEAKVQSETVQENKQPTFPAFNIPQQEAEELKNGKFPEVGGFALLIGCMQIKGDSQFVVQADDILKASLDYLSSVAGKDASTIDHFQLMAALDAYIPNIVENLKKESWIVVSFAPTKGSALARLIDGLRPYAAQVIAPIGI